jgi:MoxR-like ATPase
MAYIKEWKERIQSVIVGNDESIELCLIALVARGHVLLEDFPGTGKTTMAKTIAKTISGTFSRIQFTSDTLPTDVTGLEIFNQKTSSFQIRTGPIFANVVLIDEVNRATPRTQSALLEAMEEKQVTIAGKGLTLPEPFFVIATQNPIESVGTFPLPEAQLDRFLICINNGYPSMEEERIMLNRFKNNEPLQEVVPYISAETVREWQMSARDVHIHPDIEQYLLTLIHETRNHPSVKIGASPRASLALLRACQARAFLYGRKFITPDDIQVLATPVLAHRLLLTIEGEMNGTGKDIISQILEKISVPAEEWL